MMSSVENLIVDLIGNKSLSVVMVPSPMTWFSQGIISYKSGYKGLCVFREVIVLFFVIDSSWSDSDSEDDRRKKAKFTKSR